MALIAIYVVLAVAGFLTWLGFWKEDKWIVVFAGMVFIFGGLDILLNGFGELTSVYYQALSVILMFFGAYLTTRSTVEFIQENY